MIELGDRKWEEIREAVLSVMTSGNGRVELFIQDHRLIDIATTKRNRLEGHTQSKRGRSYGLGKR